MSCYVCQLHGQVFVHMYVHRKSVLTFTQFVNKSIYNQVRQRLPSENTCTLEIWYCMTLCNKLKVSMFMLIIQSFVCYRKHTYDIASITCSLQIGLAPCLSLPDICTVYTCMVAAVGQKNKYLFWKMIRKSPKNIYIYC